jgi:alkylated DNA repair protein alkB family protein 1
MESAAADERRHWVEAWAERSPCAAQLAEAAPWRSRPGVAAHHVHGALVVGEEDEREIFRSVWKFYKRNQADVAEYVRAVAGQVEPCATTAARVAAPPLLDFDHLHLAPPSLRALVSESVPPALARAPAAPAPGPAPDATGSRGAGSPDVEVRRAYTLRGRDGFMFVPNPFRSRQAEASWLERFALEYVAAGSTLARRNVGREGLECGALDTGLRWATLGFHYDWKQRRYTLEDRGEFPEDLALLAAELARQAGAQPVVGETAIVNYYGRGMTMGGHRDDAEWTFDAPVVSVSFGNAGVYVLGGAGGQDDAGPPPPVPLLVRSGDVVLLGGQSRVNVHGVPCQLRGTFPTALEQALLQRPGPVQQRLVEYMRETRINVNVRQVRPYAQIAQALRRAAHAVAL